MNRNYARGARAEYLAIGRLHEAGYPTTFRSAGSHGVFDVFGFNRRMGLAVQVKTGALSKSQLAAAVAQIEDAVMPKGMKRALWHHLGRGAWVEYVVG